MKTMWCGQKLRNKYDAFKLRLLCYKLKFSFTAPLTFCAACCCVGSLLTCDLWERRSCFDRRQLWWLTSAAPPASLSQQSMTVSVSPFLHFLSHCSCTDASSSAISSSVPHLPHGCSFLLFLTSWLCSDSAFMMGTVHFLHCSTHLKILGAQIKFSCNPPSTKALPTSSHPIWLDHLLEGALRRFVSEDESLASFTFTQNVSFGSI